MSDFVPVQKGTIMLLSGAKEHLYFICNDPVFYPTLVKKCFLAVNLTSMNPDIEHDPTCTLTVGDHPFIKHDSYILYSKAAIFGEDTVTQQVISGDIRTHDDCDSVVFKRILAGFLVSGKVKPKIKHYYNQYCV
jgi:hypothetical protein